MSWEARLVFNFAPTILSCVCVCPDSFSQHLSFSGLFFSLSGSRASPLHCPLSCNAYDALFTVGERLLNWPWRARAKEKRRQMDIGVAELRACLSRFEGDGKAGGGLRRGSASALGRSFRRCSSSINQRRVSATLLYGTPAPGSAAAASMLVSQELALWLDDDDGGVEMDADDDGKRHAGPKQRQTLFELLCVKHSAGSKLAQQRVTRAVVEAQRMKQRKAAEIDAAIQQRREHEQQLQKAMRDQLRRERAVSQAPRTASGLAGGAWSLTDGVPLIRLPPP